MDKKTSIFRGNYQQDAQELMSHFLIGLHNELNEICGKKPYILMEVDESKYKTEEVE